MEYGEAVEKFCKKWEERALLFYCMRNVDLLYSVYSSIDIIDFIDLDNQIIFSLIKGLNKKGIEKFDLGLLIKAANEAGVIDNIGGSDYIKSIYNMNLSEENFQNILQSVLEASTKYKLYKKLEESKELLCSSTEAASEDIIGKVESDLLDLATESKAIKEPLDVADGLVELINKRKLIKVNMTGLSTGYRILDKQIDGLINGTLMVFAARKKKGKSTFLMNIARHVAYISNIPVLYVDTEMSFDEFRNRLISSLSDVEERTVKHGGYDEDDYEALMEAAKLMKTGLLYHEKMPGYSVEKLVALYKKFKIKHNIGLAVFDYLKEPRASDTDKGRKEYQLLGDVTTRLKDLAGELDIPFITAVQLNRDHEIADSDRIARFADVISFWSPRSKKEREETSKAGTHKLVVRDSRRGGDTNEDGIGYHFFKKKLKILEVAPEYQLTNFRDED